MIPVSLLDEPGEGDLPVIGCLLRYSPRAGALLAYLLTVQDGETGDFRGGPAQWAREHSRDRKTVWAALAELRGDVPTPGGERLQVVDCDEHGTWHAAAELWAERCAVRGGRRQSATPHQWVGLRASLVRGGPWCLLSDAARVLYLYLKRCAPAQARKDSEGRDVAENPIRRAELAEALGLSESCVSYCVSLLAELGLVRRTLRRDVLGRFFPSLYSVARDYAGRLLGQAVDWSRDVTAQIRFDVPPHLRRDRCAEWWAARLRAWLVARGRRARAPARVARALSAARA